VAASKQSGFPFVPGDAPCVGAHSYIHYGEELLYRWDPAKALSNLRKHGVDFADAVTALEDEWGLHRPDPYSTGEDRWVGLGMDGLGRLLVVVYAQQEEVIRLISARVADSRERRQYEEVP
jgi:uncharacterized protein